MSGRDQLWEALKASGMREVTCPDCGLEFLTRRDDSRCPVCGPRDSSTTVLEIETNRVKRDVVGLKIRGGKN